MLLPEAYTYIIVCKFASQSYCGVTGNVEDGPDLCVSVKTRSM